MNHPEQSPRAAELGKLLRYKAWANRRVFEAVARLPAAEALKERPTRFGNMVHTLNHAFVVEDIFRSHVDGRKHNYAARNTASPPPLEELRMAVEAMDAWWIDYAQKLSPAELDEIVRFEFVGGGAGALTRSEILHHLVIHATYHRGFVGDMLYQAAAPPDATDLPVYLREIAFPPWS